MHAEPSSDLATFVVLAIGLRLEPVQRIRNHLGQKQCAYCRGDGRASPCSSMVCGMCEGRGTITITTGGEP